MEENNENREEEIIENNEAAIIRQNAENTKKRKREGKEISKEEQPPEKRRKITQDSKFNSKDFNLKQEIINFLTKSKSEVIDNLNFILGVNEHLRLEEKMTLEYFLEKIQFKHEKNIDHFNLFGNYILKSFIQEIKGLEKEKQEKETLHRCPISRELMTDPVVLEETGISYDKKNLCKHFEICEKEDTKKYTCPFTNKTLHNPLWYPNIQLRSVISDIKDNLCNKGREIIQNLILFLKATKDKEKETEQIKDFKRGVRTIIDGCIEILDHILLNYQEDDLRNARLKLDFLMVVEKSAFAEIIKPEINGVKFADFIISMSKRLMEKNKEEEGLKVLADHILSNPKMDEFASKIYDIITGLIIKNLGLPANFSIISKYSLKIVKSLVAQQKDDLALQLLLKSMEIGNNKNNIEFQKIHLSLVNDPEKREELLIKLYNLANTNEEKNKYASEAAFELKSMPAFQLLLNTYKKDNKEQDIVDSCFKMSQLIPNANQRLEIIDKGLELTTADSPIIKPLFYAKCHCFLENHDFQSYNDLIIKKNLNQKTALQNTIAIQNDTIKRLEKMLETQKKNWKKKNSLFLPIPYLNKKLSFKLNFSDFSATGSTKTIRLEKFEASGIVIRIRIVPVKEEDQEAANFVPKKFNLYLSLYTPTYNVKAKYDLKIGGNNLHPKKRLSEEVLFKHKDRNTNTKRILATEDELKEYCALEFKFKEFQAKKIEEKTINVIHSHYDDSDEGEGGDDDEDDDTDEDDDNYGCYQSDSDEDEESDSDGEEMSTFFFPFH